MQQREKTFENKIKKYIEKEVPYSWGVKFHGGTYSRSGVPDLLYCIDGYFVAIEVKAENGKPSELQKRKIKKIREAGGIAVIVKPSEFDKLKKLLQAFFEMPTCDVKKIEETEWKVC